MSGVVCRWTIDKTERIVKPTCVIDKIASEAIVQEQDKKSTGSYRK